MMTNVALAIALVFIGPYLQGARGLRTNELIVCGGSSEADGLGVSGPNFCFRRGTPGTVFGTVNAPGKERAYAYVLLVKGDEARTTLVGYDGEGGVTGPVARSNGFVEISGKKTAFAYQMTIDPQGKRPAKEALIIDGKAVDLNLGRVILIDLGGKVASWKQTNVPLPANPPAVVETKTLESVSRTNLEQLQKQSAAVREFLK